MNLKTYKYRLIATLVLYLGFSLSCTKLTGGGRSGGSSKKDKSGSENDPGKLSIGGELATDINQKLITAGVNKADADAVTQGALEISTETGLRLDAVDPNDALAIIPLIVSMIISDSSKVDDDVREIVIAIVPERATVAIDGLAGDVLSEDDKGNLPSLIIASGIKALDAAGIPKENIVTMASGIFEHTMPYLPSVSNKGAMMENIGTHGFGAMNQFNSVFATTDMATVMPNLMKNVAAVVPVDNFATFSRGAFAGMVSNPVVSGNLGLMTQVSSAMMSKAMTAYSQIAPPATFNAAAANVMAYSMGGFNGVGAAVADVFPSMISGGMGAFENISYLSGAQVGAITSSFSTAAIAQVNNFGFQGDAAKNAMGSVFSGIGYGIGSMNTSFINAGTVLGNVAQTSAASMYNYSASMGLGMNDVASTFSSFGVGMAMSPVNSWNATQLDTLNGSISTGFYNGIVTPLGAGAAATYKSSFESAAAGFVNNFQTECENRSGVWNVAGQFCNYPYIPPPSFVQTAGTAPTEADRQNCYAIGGTIMYMTATTWRCDNRAAVNNNAYPAAGTAATTSASCTAMGFTWVNGYAGAGYCNPTAPIGTCYNAATAAACTAQSGCFWDGTYCKKATNLSCYANVTQATCTMSPGCAWNPGASMCTNAAVIDCSTNPDNATCSASPACVWNGSTCLNGLTGLSCGASSTQASCLAAPGCIWIPSFAGGSNYCAPGSAFSCNSNVTNATCSMSPGCMWDGSKCFNSTAASCSGNGSYSTCSVQPGCMWTGSTCVNSSFIDCGSHNNDMAGCYGTPGCVYNGTACFNSMSASCSNNTTVSTCSTAPGCMWNGNFCMNSAAQSCGTNASETTCLASPACIWDGTFCANSMGISCSSQASPGSCSATPGCLWSGTYCMNNSAQSCGSKATNADCYGAPGCVWFGTYCANSATISCSNNTSFASCQTSPGCSWNGTFCMNAASLNCSANSTENMCMSTSGCIWNNAGSYCANSMSVNCSSNADPASCSSASGCLWNATSCVNSGAINCPSQITAPTCNTTAGCTWNGSICMNTSSISCSANITMAMCNTTTGCMWNGAICANSSAINCSSNITAPTCSTTAGCLWDSSTCVNSSTISCGAYTSGTCNTHAGCAWDAGMNICRNSSMVSCSSNMNPASCTGPSCSWTGTFCQNAATMTCPMYTNQSFCDPDPNCHWNPTFFFCEYDSAPSCSSYSAMASCENNFACDWNGGSCADASNNCTSYTQEWTCNGNPACDWMWGPNLCQNAAISCSSYTTSGACKGNPGCNYVAGVCQNDASGGNCGGWADITSCQSHGCNWGGAACNPF